MSAPIVLAFFCAPFQYSTQVQAIDSIDHNMPNFIVQTLRQIMERRGFQIEDGGVLRLNLNPTDAARAWEIEEGEEWAAWAAEEEQDLPGENVEKDDVKPEMKSDDEIAQQPARCKTPSRDRDCRREREEEPSGAPSQRGKRRSKSRRREDSRRPLRRKSYPSKRGRSASRRRSGGRGYGSGRDTYRSSGKQCSCPPGPPPPPRRRSRSHKKSHQSHTSRNQQKR